MVLSNLLRPKPASRRVLSPESPSNASSISSKDSWSESELLAQREDRHSEEATENSEDQSRDSYSQFPDDYNYTRDDDSEIDNSGGAGSENGGDSRNTDSSIAPVTGSTLSKAEPKLRKRFGPDEDYLLLIQVNKDMPFKAKHGEIRRSWQELAQKLNSSPNFLMEKIKGTTAQARFETLLTKHYEWEEKSASKSGTDERETRFVTLITNVASKVADHKKARDIATANAAGAERAKVQAGEVVRAAAVSRIELGKRKTDSQGGDDDRLKKQQSRLASQWNSVAAEIKNERAKALEHLVQMQQAELKQRERELDFERAERERDRVERHQEREERQRDREEQTKLITNLLQIIQAKHD